MKNFINYYYNFNIYNLKFSNGKYYFYNNKEKYVFKICENPNLLKCYVGLNTQLSKYHNFFLLISNKDNNSITWINRKPYIMLKISNIMEERINIYDIKSDLYINIDNNNSMLNHFPWIRLWENKIDFFEKYISDKQDSYKKIFPIFHYFIGIAENALLYLKETEIESKKDSTDSLVVSHVRLTINDSLYDYYDVTNLIIDHHSRDISEYIKSAFLNKTWDLDMLKKYIKKNKFSEYGLRTLLARIIFPSYFFDYLENMINNDKKIDLLYMESRTEEFEKFVKEICMYFNETYGLPMITWITK